MKTGKLTSAVAIAALGIGVIVGCGGGGSSGSSAVASTMNEETAIALGDNFAKLDGCNVVALNAPVASRVRDTIMDIQPDFAAVRSYNIDHDIPGECGGSVRVTGKHDSGTTSLLLNMSDMCLPVRSKQVSMTGKTDFIEHGKPGVYGPVVSYDTAGTRGHLDGSVADNSKAAPVTFSMAFSGFKHAYGSGDKQVPATESKPDTMVLSSGDLIDANNKKYIISGVNAKTYPTARGIKVKTGTATYTDPDKGTFTVKYDGLEIIGNKSIIPGIPGPSIPEAFEGTASLTATDGTKGLVKFENFIITVSYEDENGTLHEASKVDCTNL
jgi:hypothetical protein